MAWQINSNISLSQNELSSSSTNPFFISCSGDTLLLQTPRTPASSSAAGYEGEICWDNNYLYVYRGNQWRRTSLDSTPW